MSNVLNLADNTANTMASALAPLFDSGFIEIFTGTQPVNANTALSGNTLLATLTFGSTAFGAPAAGVITANAITPGTAGNSGTATFCRCYESNGTSTICDGTVGTSGAFLNINTTSIVSGGLVQASALTITVTET
jgi:hypothetical protein